MHWNENRGAPFKAVLDPLMVLSRVTDSGSRASTSEGSTPSTLQKHHYIYVNNLGLEHRTRGLLYGNTQYVECRILRTFVSALCQIYTHSVKRGAI